MRLPTLALLALLLATPPAFAVEPEEPVGPVSFQAYRLTDELPAASEGRDGPDAPRSTAVPSSTQLTVRSSYVGRKAAEPTLGIDRDGTAFYAAGDFDGAGGAAARTEVFRSVDGGLTWQEVTPKVGGQDVPPGTLDPYVYVDQRTDRAFSIDLAGAGSYLTYSDDGGATWLPSAISAPGANDHQTFFTGPPAKSTPLPASPIPWPTVAYYCVNAVTSVGCSRSTDGGITFQPLPAPPYAGCFGCQTGHGVVDPEGRVLLPRAEYLSLTNDINVQLAVSADSGASWRTSEVSTAVPPAGRHTSVATDAAGNIYYVWWDSRFNLPWMAISRDHGATWGDPLMIAPPGVHDVNFPVVTAGDEGRVAIAFPGSSVDDPADATRPWHGWIVVSDDALSADPTFRAAPADDGTDPLHRGACTNRCSGMFDFIDIQVSPKDGSAWATFTDTCTNVASCRTQRKTGAATDAKAVAARTVGGPSLLAELPAPTPAASAPLGAPSSPTRLADRRR